MMSPVGWLSLIAAGLQLAYVLQPTTAQSEYIADYCLMVSLLAVAAIEFYRSWAKRQREKAARLEKP